jgi:hypothetical protein
MKAFLELILRSIKEILWKLISEMKKIWADINKPKF